MGVNYFKEKNQIKAAVTERKDELARLSLESKLEVIKRGDIADIEMDLVGWMTYRSSCSSLLPY